MRNSTIAMTMLAFLTLAACAPVQGQQVIEGSGYALGPITSGPLAPALPGECTSFAVAPGANFILASPDNGDWDIFFDGQERRAHVTPGDEAGIVPGDATTGTACPFSAAAPPLGFHVDGNAPLFNIGETSFEYVQFN